MYFKFNETNILTGYIKELLHEFNLPSYTVWRDDKPVYKDRLYIKGDDIVKCTDSDSREFLKLDRYLFNKKYENVTKNLVINSSVYDSYTHSYLGNYLRFLRDYKNLDLMSLYNCFNTEIPVGLNYNITLEDGDIYRVNTTSDKYLYYIVPVKFNEEYTICIDAPVAIEASCIIYTGDKVLPISKDLSRITYQKISGSKYNKPTTLFSTKVDESKFKKEFYHTAYWRYENNLRLLLKLPKVVNSSITVLEGNYLNSSTVCGTTMITQTYINDNSTDLKFNSKLSLLTTPGTTSYPFADRLIEYLLGMAITNLEYIPNNVSRVQDALLRTTYFYDGEEVKPLKFKGFYDVWGDYLKNTLYRKLVNEETNRKNYNEIYKYDPKSGEYVKIEDIYNNLRPIDLYEDLLGYVDRDVEDNLYVKTIIK